MATNCRHGNRVEAIASRDAAAKERCDVITVYDELGLCDEIRTAVLVEHVTASLTFVGSRADDVTMKSYISLLG